MRNVKKILSLLLCVWGSKSSPTTIDLNSSWWAKPISFMYPIPEDISELCKSDTLEFLSNIQTKSLWARKMMDASGRLQSGLHSTHIRSLGNFDQCISIENPSQKFVGKYCLLKLDFGTNILEPVFDQLMAEYFHFYIKELETVESQYLKYFPTFLIGKWALCLPSSCSKDDITTLGTTIFNRATENMNLSASIVMNELDCTTALSEKPYGTAEYLALTVFGITLLMIIASTYMSFFLKKGQGCLIFFPIVLFFLGHVILYHQSNLVYTDQSLSGLKKLVHSFSLIDNWNQWLDLNSSRSLKFLEGIRALSALNILFVHERFLIYSLPYINLDKLIKGTYNYTFSPIWADVGSVEVFCILSGLLRSYSLMKSYDEGNFEIIKPIVRRYLRFTVTYAFILLFMATINDRIGSGPEWHYYSSLPGEMCSIHWWKHLLYFNNYNLSFCLLQSWYLAMDMQMFLVAPLLVYPLWKWNILGKLIMAFALIISCIVPIVQLYFLNFPGPDLFFATPFNELYGMYFYARTHNRMSPFFVGMWMGVFLHRNTTLNLSNRMRKVAWLVNFLVFMLYIYWKILSESLTFWEKVLSATFLTFGRLTFSIGVAWIIYTCYTEKDGIVTRFLSCNIFNYLGKISYCLYLSHLTVLTYNLGIIQTPEQVHVFVMIRNIIGHYGICLFFALGLHILVESPFSKITDMFVNSINSRNRNRYTVTNPKLKV